MSLRRRYYNLFSLFYDGFIRLHSRDAGESMRCFHGIRTEVALGGKAKAVYGFKDAA